MRVLIQERDVQGEVKDAPGEAARKLRALTRALVTSHGFIPHVRGMLPAGPCIMVANHLSYIDPVLLTSLIPCTPIAKAEIATWPFLGPVMERRGTLFVERGNPWSGARVLRSALRSLAAGVSVINFPEGTTTVGDQVLPFKRGIFGIARHAGVPVVPVALKMGHSDLCWTGDDAFVPHYLRTIGFAENGVFVRMGAPLDPMRYATAAALARAARSRIQRLLDCDGTDHESSEVAAYGSAA